MVFILPYGIKLWHILMFMTNRLQLVNSVGQFSYYLWQNTKQKKTYQIGFILAHVSKGLVWFLGSMNLKTYCWEQLFILCQLGRKFKKVNEPFSFISLSPPFLVQVTSLPVLLPWLIFSWKSGAETLTLCLFNQIGDS